MFQECFLGVEMEVLEVFQASLKFFLGMCQWYYVERPEKVPPGSFICSGKF